MGSRPLLVDLQVVLAIAGFSLSFVASLLALIRLRRGAKGHVRTLWWIIFYAAGALAATSAIVAFIAGRFPATPVSLLVGGAMSFVILGLLVAVRLAALIIDEGYERQDELMELRRALHDHQSSLQTLVAQRTQSLRKEIAERRSVQKKLHLWNQQQERELAMAGRVQKALLPKIRSTGFCALEMVYRPFAEVSGDTYMYASNEAEFSLVLADAMGHGVPAALVTQVVQTEFSRLAVSTGGRELFARINESLFRGAQVTFATASHLHVSNNGRAFFTSAGAPSIMLWRSQDGTIERMDGAGFALGMFDDVGDEYRVQELRLAVGDKLLMYTDGLSELKDSLGLHMGEDGLQAWFRVNAQASLVEIRERLLQELIGSDSIYHLSDDITAVLLEFRGVPATG